MYSNKQYKSTNAPKAQGASLLQQPETDAIQSILSTKKGERYFDKILELSDNLVIRQSGLGQKAGKGLFIAAKNADLRLKAKTPLTFFNGSIHDYEKSSHEDSSRKCYTIGLGSTLKAAAKVIISDPDDINPVGSAHFANHSTLPNCELSYLYGDFDIIAVLIVLTDDIIIAKDHALELVFDYGDSAEVIHGIKDTCKYKPHIKPMSHFDEEDQGEFFLPNHHDIDMARCDRLAQRSREKSFPKELKSEASDKLKFLAEKSLPKTSFSIIDSSDDDAFVNLFARKESYYFIQIYQHDIRWILMHVARSKSGENSISLFDPDGDLGSKVLSQWFFGLDLTNTTFNFIQSRCIDNTYGAKYGHTHVSCVALARLMLNGLHDSSVGFNTIDSQAVSKLRRMTWLFSNVSHSNIQLKSKDPLSTLMVKLLTNYPQHAQVLSLRTKLDMFLEIISLLQSDFPLETLECKDGFFESRPSPFQDCSLENAKPEKKRLKARDYQDYLPNVVIKREKKMPKRKVENLLLSAEQYIPKESFAVIEGINEGEFIDLLTREESFYFIKTYTTDNRFILMYVDRTDSGVNNIYFFDPEGASNEKVHKDWFEGLDLTTTRFHFILSWFIFDKYCKNAYANTDLICLALAQVLLNGLKQFTFLEIQGPKHTRRQNFVHAKHFNIDFNFKDPLSEELSQLLTAYPLPAQSMRREEINDILSRIKGLLSSLKPVLPGVEVEPVLPGVEVEPVLPGVEVEPVLPGDEVEPVLPGDEVEPVLPGDEVEPALPGDEVEPALLGDGSTEYGHHPHRRRHSFFGSELEPVCKREKLMINTRETLLDFLIKRADQMKFSKRNIVDTIRWCGKEELNKFYTLCNAEEEDKSILKSVETELEYIYKQIDSAYVYD